MPQYVLNKAVLSIRSNPAGFLNGLTSNTPDKPRNAFLDIRGRIIAVFDQVKINEDEFWVVLENEFVDKLLGHLDRYVKLSGVDIRRLDKYVYFVQESHRREDGKSVIPQKMGNLVIADKLAEAIPPDDAFTLMRLRHLMPVQGVDFTDEFVLNVDPAEYVSFTKGCFLGQEPVSKVHNRSRPTWRLVVQYEDECNDESRGKMTSKVLDPDTKRVLGFTFIRNENG